MVAAGAKALEARVAATEPTSLSATLETDSQVVRVKPLLLNPNDKITINILTSGQTPSIAPRARIAGVSDVKMQSAASSTRSVGKAILSGVFTLAGLVAYFFLAGAAIHGARNVALTRPVIYAISGAIAGLTGLASALILKMLEIDPSWSGLAIFILAISAIGIIVMRLSRKWYWSKQTL